MHNIILPGGLSRLSRATRGYFSLLVSCAQHVLRGYDTLEHKDVRVAAESVSSVKGDMSSSTEESTPGPTTVQSVDRAASILEMLSAESPLGVSEIARRLDVHRSTAFRLLATLEARDLVEQISDRGAYRLGFALLHMAHSVIRRVDLARDAQACCDELAMELKETVNVAVLDSGYAVTITQAAGERMIGVARQYVGQRGPLHATSTGKVLLAHDAAELHRLTAAPLEAFTASTMTDRAALSADLEAVRRRGWAAAVAEWEEGTNALAVPVRNASGSVVAAVAMTAPAFRLPESRFAELAETLREGARQIEVRLGAA